ncbi:Short-chain dehydrogenase/reductase SDR [Hyella patelloides LEGE 07179]|uniref:Short-chain dehydrogenase/reductase SDR n=1 Tax=Hyella patelloides LEGE 07179 TaxID=945734 RepID=A0A563VVX2_9CYAN|nr:SDR family NAD(P)-dependent oxidoreductase [Hyella patelloides]VEP15560.1 Short-chain dehydrogenase/reductase SDR [Hyella patelloides LEGE 07179]
MKFSQKTALVTGASRGIGKAIALALARQDLKTLLLVARDGAKLAELATEIQALNSRIQVIVLPLDLTQIKEVSIAVTKAMREYGAIHLLVNCAGVAHQNTFLQTNPSQIEAEVSLNLVGTYNITRLIAKRMVHRREGTIVNVSSLMGKIAAPTMATYSATKFALVGFTQALKAELAPDNVRVVALLPSLTDTDMVKGLKLFRFVQPMTAQKVASALIAGLKREREEICVGWQSYLALLCQRFTPWLLDLVLSVTTPILKQPSPSRFASLRP